MTFVQIIDYETTREPEMEAVFDEWEKATEGKRTVTREIHSQDRENPRHYVDVVEFPSYEAAMRNNDLPDTQRLAGKFRELCTREPKFTNLEVVQEL